MERAAPPSRDRPLSVSQLTHRIKATLERGFPRIWIVGEISNYKRAGSGHWYFSLKDADSQVRCAMWRSYTHQVRFRPTDGAEVLIAGALNVYPPRGEYSLIVEQMEEVGLGRLRAELERLKARLMAEGLFDPAHKKPLPLLPTKVGIVTSPTGAAIRDILRVLRVRFAGLHVLIFPVRVQGEGAAREIAEGIRYLDSHGDCDVLIVGRGGGSEEDLWSFNEEIVVRAIFEASTPIISAVGHEVDTTLSDHVADLRAATPSNAAELVVRSRAEYAQTIQLCLRTMEKAVQHRLLMIANRVKLSESNPIFVAVRSRINDAMRRLAELEHGLLRRTQESLQNRRFRLIRAGEALSPEHLMGRARLLEQRLGTADRELGARVLMVVRTRREQFGGLVNRLEDLSPLKILGRGYAAVFDDTGRVLRDPDKVKPGTLIRARLQHGDLHARVIEARQQTVQESLFDEDDP